MSCEEPITQTRYFSGVLCWVVIGEEGDEEALKNGKEAIKLPCVFVETCLEGKSKPVPDNLRHFIPFSGCECGEYVVILMELAEWLCDDTNFERTWKTYTDKEFIAFE